MGPRVRYLLNEVGIGLRRNLLMTLATVVTLTVSLSLLGAGLLAYKQVNKARDLFYAQVEVSIYLQDTISTEQRESLERDLRQNPEVASVLYESKEEAYEHFRELFAEDPTVRDSVTPEVLPASFRVKLVDPEQFAVVKSQYSGYPGIEEIVDQRKLLEEFFSIMKEFRRGALSVALLQLGAATALIFNTIRVTAFARREQTGIMKLVGATNWYIRLPFVLEGIIAGFVGAILAGGLLLVGETTLLDSIREKIHFIPFVGTAEVLAIFPFLLLAGVGLAAVSSILALRRFLSV